MRRKVEEADPYPILKIKMGFAGDVDVLERIRAMTDKPIRVDANEGWTRAEALARLPALEDLGVELLEQPVPAADREGLALVSGATAIPVVADESCRTTADLAGLLGVVDAVNVKLAKTGSIGEAVRLMTAARALHFGVFLGCMVESSLGIAAAAHLAPLAGLGGPGRPPAPLRRPVRGAPARGRPRAPGPRRPRSGSPAEGVEPPGTAFALTYARLRGALRSRTRQTIARQSLRSPGRSGWGAGDAGAGFRYLRFAQKSDPVSECLREKGSRNSAARGGQTGDRYAAANEQRQGGAERRTSCSALTEFCSRTMVLQHRNSRNRHRDALSQRSKPSMSFLNRFWRIPALALVVALPIFSACADDEGATPTDPSGPTTGTISGPGDVVGRRGRHRGRPRRHVAGYEHRSDRCERQLLDHERPDSGRLGLRTR